MTAIVVNGNDYSYNVFNDAGETIIEVTDANGDFFAEAVIDHGDESISINYTDVETMFPYYEYANPAALVVWMAATAE